MSRIPKSTDGAEFRDTLFWSSISGVITISTTTYHLPGAASYYIGHGQTGYKVYPVSATFVQRVWVYRGSSGASLIIVFYDSLNVEQGRIFIDGTTGLIKLQVNGVVKATGTHVIPVAEWHMLEAKYFLDDAGSLAARVDGIDDVSWSGDTKPGAATQLTYVGLGAVNGVYVDDLAADDSGWIGDGRSIVGVPSGAGGSTMLALVGAAANWDACDEAPPDSDTSYVQSATSPDRDLYAQTLLPSLTGYKVLRVWAEGRLKNVTAAARTAELAIARGSEHWDAAAQTPGTQYERIVGDEYTTDPETASAWTNANVAALQIGVKVQS